LHVCVCRCVSDGVLEREEGGHHQSRSPFVCACGCMSVIGWGGALEPLSPCHTHTITLVIVCN
jgi:hypothetical protein